MGENSLYAWVGGVDLQSLVFHVVSVLLRQVRQVMASFARSSSLASAVLAIEELWGVVLTSPGLEEVSLETWASTVGFRICFARFGGEEFRHDQGIVAEPVGLDTIINNLAYDVLGSYSPLLRFSWLCPIWS